MQFDNNLYYAIIKAWDYYPEYRCLGKMKDFTGPVFIFEWPCRFYEKGCDKKCNCCYKVSEREYLFAYSLFITKINVILLLHCGALEGIAKLWVILRQIIKHTFIHYTVLGAQPVYFDSYFQIRIKNIFSSPVKKVGKKMKQIVIAQEEKALANPLINDVYRLRHETFIDRLDWDISSVDGMERDNFDDLHPYHIAIRNDIGTVDGCWRALPTTGDYMLKDVFPELLQGERAPQLPNVWEISRFAVRKGSAESTRGYMSEITIEMVRSFHEFACQKGIKSYVTVTTVACERLLRQLGVECRRMGAARALQIGKERSVALWIKVNDRLLIHTH